MEEKPKKRSAKRVSTASKLKSTVKKIVGAGSSKSKSGACCSDDLQRRIQDKAYELYVNRGCSHGDDMADWYEAERLVKAEIGA